MTITVLRQKQHVPTVLNTEVLERIGLMNDVARDLKNKGLVLGQQELYPLRWQNRPSIEINRKLSLSIMSVVCNAAITWFDEGVGYANYRGVTVWWRQYE